MADHIQAAVDQPVHPELFKDPRFDLLRRHVSLPLDHRVVDVIIKDPCGNCLFPRMEPFLQPEGRVHIDHQLELESMVKQGQVKGGAPGLIIHDLYQDPVLLL